MCCCARRALVSLTRLTDTSDSGHIISGASSHIYLSSSHIYKSNSFAWRYRCAPISLFEPRRDVISARITFNSGEFRNNKKRQSHLLCCCVCLCRRLRAALWKYSAPYCWLNRILLSNPAARGMVFFLGLITTAARTPILPLHTAHTHTVSNQRISCGKQQQ